MARQRRDRFEIIAQLLASGMKPSSRADLMYAARLDFRGLQHHVDLLNSIGLLENSGGVFKTTEKGLAYLQLYGKVAKMLAKG